jgi:hypothetical protein
MAVAARARVRKTADDHVGTESPDHADDIAQNVLFPPKFERFLGRLGITEELFGSVDPTGRQELMGSDEADFSSLFRTDQILAALASSDRKVGGPKFPPLGEIGQKGGVFIVRMSADIQNAPQDVELLKSDFQFAGAGDSPLLGLDREMEPQDRTQDYPNNLFQNRPSSGRKNPGLASLIGAN